MLLKKVIEKHWLTKKSYAVEKKNTSLQSSSEQFPIIF